MNVQIESGLPAMVTGKQPRWLYLRPRAFPSYFLPVHSEGGGMRVQLGEGLAAMQGQPTAVRSAILLQWLSTTGVQNKTLVREYGWGRGPCFCLLLMIYIHTGKMSQDERRVMNTSWIPKSCQLQSLIGYSLHLGLPFKYSTRPCTDRKLFWILNTQLLDKYYTKGSTQH